MLTAVHPGENVIPAQQTSLKGFTRKEEARRVAASRVRSSNRLNRVQSLYKVSWLGGGVEFSRVVWDWWKFEACFWGKLGDWWDSAAYLCKLIDW